ncbi:uncharacterized protein [Ptychodera flava]|uniref:uncharacterized protein isoform X2 n=1 Tax=Ptychodera flava TaxID=63121 RepID=UPI00396A4E86
MTLKAAEVHCRGIFSPGQLYTALSRLKSTEGLRVVGFKPEYLIKPNAEVIRFMTDATESNEPADPSLQCCRKINQEQDCAGEQQPVQQVDELLPSASNSLGDSDSECDEDNVLVTQVFNELPNHTSHCNDDHGETTDLQAAAELLKDDSELSSLPQDFSVEEFFNTLEDHSSFASIPGSSPHNLNCLLQSLQNADKHHSRAFLSLQWSRIYHLIKGNSESESVEKANKKTFVSYLSDFHEYVTTNENLECEFKQLCGTLTLTDTHYECLADICISLRNQLVEKLATAVRLKMSAGRTTSTDHRNSSENMTNEGKGKVRFVGGWTVAKEREKNRRYLKGNIGSTDAEVRRNLRRAYTKKVLLDSVTVPAAAIATNTAYPETLSFTQHKQNRRNGLTHITDKAFMFFLRVEDMRNVCLTQSNLDRHKENLINNTVTSVLNDKSMQAEFIKALEIPEEMLAKDVHTSHDATLTSEAESCAYALFSDVVKRYFNMGTGQFLRDHRRDFKVQKTTAHRKRVMQREQSSLTKLNKIGVVQFISDSSDNKMFSHTLLQSRVTANPKFFEERIYTKQELKLFFLLYNLTYVRSHTKSTMNSKLVNRIKESQCILNTAALQQYLDGLGPLEKRPRFN